MKLLGLKETVIVAMLFCYASPIVAQSPTPTPLPAYTIPPPISSIIPTISPTTPPTATPASNTCAPPAAWEVCDKLAVEVAVQSMYVQGAKSAVDYAMFVMNSYIGAYCGGNQPTDLQIANDPNLQFLKQLADDAAMKFLDAVCGASLLYQEQIANNCDETWPFADVTASDAADACVAP